MAHEPKEALDFGDKAKIKVNIYTAIGICGTLLASGWMAAQKLDKIIEGETRMERALTYKWSASQMTAWANQLEKNNRTLIVPDPGAIRLPDPEMSTINMDR